MKKLGYIILAIMTATLTFSCDFRPLEKIGNTHYVRVYIDEHILNLTEGFYNQDYTRPGYRRPEVMKVVLADPDDGRVVAEKYLRSQGDDEHGHYYDGYIICDPGKWNMMAWNFDTEATRISSPSNIYEAGAYTSGIASHLYGALWSRTKGLKGVIDGTKSDGSTLDGSKTEFDFSGEKIAYEPDHLFVAKEDGVSIGYTGSIDTLRTSSGGYFQAESIVETWFIQVNITGVSRLSSSNMLLSGMSGSKRLIDGELDRENPVTVYFEMNANAVTDAEKDTGVLYSTFSTFGRLPDGKNMFNVSFDMTTKAGKAVSATFDITDEFDKDNAKNHRWIILDRSILIPESEPGGQGGGFSPGVRDWNDVNTDLTI